MDPASQAYLWWKAAHVVTVITWMAGLFHLPRLFVYHAMAPIGSDQSELLKVMERRLVLMILHPSLVGVLTTGAVLAPAWIGSEWLHAKFVLVAVLIACHLAYTRWRMTFVRDRNTRSHVFYRVASEVPIVALVGIIVLVVLKPF
ncbi:MAG: CopD family protein [Alphaproteobacteria bacterium]